MARPTSPPCRPRLKSELLALVSWVPGFQLAEPRAALGGCHWQSRKGLCKECLRSKCKAIIQMELAMDIRPFKLATPTAFGVALGRATTLGGQVRQIASS